MIEFKFQTKTEIQALLAEAGTNPRHRWGQNFLIDGNLLRRLLGAADIQPTDAVLEVGAGTGALTEYLAATATAVIAVEIDPALHAILERRLGHAAHVTLLNVDALSGKHRIAPAVRRAFERAATDAPGKLMLVANLPYSIATPLLMDLLLDDCRFHRFCFTVQRELADRILARERTREFSPLSIVTQAACDIKRLAVLPPSVFWPQPKVESAMLRIDVRRNPFNTAAGLRRFASLVRGAFTHRRKTLRYNLARLLGDDPCRALDDEFDLTQRPDALSVNTWIRLARHIPHPLPPFSTED